MCYEFSNWFLKARAKELHKARDIPGDVAKAPVDSTAAPEAPLPKAKKPDKVPA
jgi:hypothetical protein